MFKRRFGRIIIVGLIGITTITIRNIRIRLNDLIEETNEFNIHTNIEQKKHFISGMHQPFLTQDKNELNLFNLYFKEYDFLIENNLNKIKEKHSLKNPIQFKSKSDLKTNEIDYLTSTLIVGGAPALISSISLIKNKENLIYLNNLNRIPISNGSAWHLEEDAQTEAPTNYKPTRFIFEQLKRLLLNNIRLKDINKTGEFPWRTIDWIEWIRHPEHWLRAFEILIKYQLFTMFSNRTNILNDVSKQCLINELFFNQLNQLLNNKILLEDSGSIIIAKNKEEINELYQLKNDLNKEGRYLNILSKEELFNRYSFIPNGFLFGEKIHDRVLLPNFLNIIQKYLIEQGQTIIDGTLQTIYIDQNKEGGIASFKDQNGKEKLIEFNRCILSLGNQEIFNENNQRLFNVISARGVSILAHVYLPKDSKLPPVLVCGGTNHVTKLSSKPILIDKNHFNLYLMRFTSGACITPNISNEYTAYYDSTIAIGLLKSIEQCLGDQSLIKPILVYGCNRQVSQYGQIHWIQPYTNIFIQYGAAGGGLTRAPDFITTYLSKS